MRWWTRKEHNFVGKIFEKKEEKEYNIGKVFYRIKIKTEGNEIKEAVVYQKKVSEEIWNTLKNNLYLNKQYLFICEKLTTNLHLTNWKEA